MTPCPTQCHHPLRLSKIILRSQSSVCSISRVSIRAYVRLRNRVSHLALTRRTANHHVLEKQEIERQAKLEKAAEVGVLSNSGSVSGLKVDIDQGAIQQAREVNGFFFACVRCGVVVVSQRTLCLSRRKHVQCTEGHHCFLVFKCGPTTTDLRKLTQYGRVE